MQRQVTGLGQYDYVYWSSPVDAFNVQDVSPNTPVYGRWLWVPTVANGTTGEHGEWNTATGNMTVGQGYAVRSLLGTTTANTAEFSGVSK